ncbi:MAG: hypothetical protein PHV37_09970 [Candidatus Gastranaerophilales bacterium]|nr:hypothetical protein [Candidatus Gastranaerophilales bacterium]
MKRDINKQEKISFIGISLSALSTTESAAAVLDKNLKIIKLDKLFSMADVEFFLTTLPSKHNSIVTVSIPENETMISSKWKYNSRTYQPVNLNSPIKNVNNWSDRFSTRGSEFLKNLYTEGLDIFRFDLDNVKKEMGHSAPFKNRTPTDCKAIQNTLKMEYGMRELPTNMLPVAQLEAIMGAFLAHKLAFGEENIDYKTLYEFEELEVLGLEPNSTLL